MNVNDTGSTEACCVSEFGPSNPQQASRQVRSTEYDEDSAIGLNDTPDEARGVVIVIATTTGQCEVLRWTRCEIHIRARNRPTGAGDIDRLIGRVPPIDHFRQRGGLL